MASKTFVRSVFSALAGLLLGLLLGFAVAFALIVVRAHFLEVWLHSFGELLGWPLIPLVLGPVAGVALALTGRGRRLAAGVVWGLGVGIPLGVVVGALVTGREAGPWAGGVVGAAVGMLVALGAALTPRGHALGVAVHERMTAASTTVRVGVVAALLALGGAAAVTAVPETTAPLPPAGAVPPADTSGVEAVVLLVGDAGAVTWEDSPLLHRVRDDVELWSQRLGPDGEVHVLFLGDWIYPDGLSPVGAPGRVQDSLYLAGQIETVSGPVARANGATGWFVPGNHDWGQEEDFAGAVRVMRVAEFLEPFRAQGVEVRVAPEPGTGGPEVVDVGDHLRLLFLDTAWWLLEGEPDRRAAVIDGVDQAMATAAGREVVLAAHHPFASVGPHGSLVDIGSMLGFRTLLARSGAMLQDLYSRPYEELRTSLLDVFERRGTPAAFVGGHEHSLQSIRGLDARAPRRSIVSGSASKLTGVEPAPGLLFARSAPGYGTLLVREDGSLRLRLHATPARWQQCPDPTDVACMAEGYAAFRTVWAETIPPRERTRGAVD